MISYVFSCAEFHGWQKSAGQRLDNGRLCKSTCGSPARCGGCQQAGGRLLNTGEFETMLGQMQMTVDVSVKFDVGLMFCVC
jgi:hypothetical protein